MRASLNPASKLPAGRGFRSRAAAVAACLGLSVVAPAAWPSSLTPLPDFEAVKAGHTRSDLLVLDRHGEAIAALRRDYLERRGAWIPVDAISPALQRAVLLSEDRRFYEHGGVDWLAMSAAGWNWLWGDGPRGASTLSMQLVGMLDDALRRPGGGRSLEQKIEQARRARQLESIWTKPQILEAYLNLVAFRGELRGVDAVSRVMFGKHPHGLDRREAAVAAALLRGPNAPAERVSARACALLAETAEPAACATLADHVRQWLAATAQPAADMPALAPHFARLALAAAQPSGAGTPLRTTLDAGLQRVALASVQRHLAGMGHAQLTDAAVVVLDNRSAEILAYVGSSGEASAAGQVDHARTRRQAGSTLKPFLYAQALQARYLTAASLLEDSALDVATTGGLYVPQNYDRNHAGLVSMRSALASSLNIPAVRTLMLVGPERFADLLRRLGLPLVHDADHYGYSLSLGSADVDLLSLTNAYRVLADQGYFREPVMLARPDDVQPHQPDRLLDPLASWIVADVLSDRQARTRTFGLENALGTRFWSAVKTGTSKDMRDNWTLGWSSDYTVGVWVGNSQGLSMQDVSGVTGAAPIWHEVLSHLHAGLPSRPTPPPAGLESRRVVFADGLEASRIEHFLPGTAVSRVEPATQQALPDLRIASPAQGTVIALDPDMPAGNQKLLLRAAAGPGVGADLRWHVGGAYVGRGPQAYWRPSSGRHRVTLRDEQGRVLDEVSIEVRGLPRLARRR